MKKENNQKNPKNKKYNWDYHEKLYKKYEHYLIENKDKNNLRLKGNYHYENKPLNYYLYKKDFEPINNSNLTPLPQSKFLNNKTIEKNKDDYKKFSNVQKSVKEMRRIEYNANLNKIKKKEKTNEDDINVAQLIQINQLREFKKIIKVDKKEVKRKSCIQFGYKMKLNDKFRKTINLADIIDYIIKNVGKVDEDDFPPEVKSYLILLIPALMKIQKRYRMHLKNLKKIVKIQVNYRAYLYYKLFKDYLKRKNTLTQFIFIIQKVLFLNLYHLKINPNPKYSTQKSFIIKKIFTTEYLEDIIILQRKIKKFLLNRKIKRINGKKKCVYIKPYTIKPLGKIILLQRNVCLFLQRLKRRHIKPNSQFFVKRKIHTKKLVLIQRFAKMIHQEIIYPLIPKDSFNQNNIYIKSNVKTALKKGLFIDTKIIPFNPKVMNIVVRNKDSNIKKFHKYLAKLIFLQRSIKEYLSREDYDVYDYPKIDEYITKECFVLPHKENILLLQRQIKYFIYRQNIKKKTMKKIVIVPLRITKSIRTNTEKIFMRLSKLRIMYDKNMILFIVKVIENIKKYLGRTAFELIKKESKKKKIFSIRGGHYKNTFAKSKFIKYAVYKVIEPEYKFVPIKPEKRKQLSNKNNKFLSLLSIGKKNNTEKIQRCKTKRSQKSDINDVDKIEEKVDENEKDENNYEKNNKKDEKDKSDEEREKSDDDGSNKNEKDNDKNDKHSKNTIELKSNKSGMDTIKVGENLKFENSESVFSSEDKK